MPRRINKSGPLSLTDDATDLARRNLQRIREQGGAPVRTRRERRSGGALAPKAKPVDWKGVADVATDFVPGVGEAKDIARAAGNVAAGNYGAAALDAATAAVGVVPGIGDAAAAGIRAARKAADPFVRNVHGFQRANQRVPDLVPNKTVWNTIHSKALKGEDVTLGDITWKDKARLERGENPDQLGRNASIEVDGKQIPVVLVPNKHPEFKWHVITVRDQKDKVKGKPANQVLGGREYNRGGSVGGK